MMQMRWNNVLRIILDIIKAHKSQYADYGCSYVNTKWSEACAFLEHAQRLHSLHCFLLRQMQTKRKAAGFAAIKSFVNSTLETFSSCFRLKRSPLLFKSFKTSALWVEDGPGLIELFTIFEMDRFSFTWTGSYSIFTYKHVIKRG